MLGHCVENVSIDILESPRQSKLTLELSGRPECDGKESYKLTIPASTASLGDVGGD